MKKLIFILFCVATLFTACSKQTETVSNDKAAVTNKAAFKVIIANGYGESEEKAVEDAKNDALRQFGFNIADNRGKPELVYAGRIINIKIVSNYSEELKNGMWWEIKIEAEIEKL